MINNTLDWNESSKPLGWTMANPPVYRGFEFEKFNVNYWSEKVAQSDYIAYFAISIYVPIIFGLKWYLRDRRAFKLERPLFIWNLSIGIFSLVTFIRVAPGLVLVIMQPNGMYNSICVKEGMDIPTLYWSMLFTLSKFVELGDTVFIVLRKRPLIFLQWYHHLITLWAVWLSTPYGEPILRWYGVLNTGVHTLMYLYLAMRAIGWRLPTPLVNVITTVQFVQMLVGFCVNTFSWYFYYIGYDCARHPGSIKIYAFLYFSFIILFGKLFHDSVIKGGRRSKVQNDRNLV